ncbi:MAG: hypothetical protein GWN88_01910 [Nitrospinaceae bacterium]|nr:hypothetical protein [Nitrospinaceae bacterium]NIU95142.1 hypothetical protein [Nitrospinaceae bacterium]
MVAWNAAEQDRTFQPPRLAPVHHWKTLLNTAQPGFGTSTNLAPSTEPMSLPGGSMTVMIGRAN